MIAGGSSTYCSTSRPGCVGRLAFFCGVCAPSWRRTSRARCTLGVHAGGGARGDGHGRYFICDVLLRGVRGGGRRGGVSPPAEAERRRGPALPRPAAAAASGGFRPAAVPAADLPASYWPPIRAFPRPHVPSGSTAPALLLAVAGRVLQEPRHSISRERAEYRETPPLLSIAAMARDSAPTRAKDKDAENKRFLRPSAASVIDIATSNSRPKGSAETIKYIDHDQHGAEQQVRH